jgi:hypothetical protein
MHTHNALYYIFFLELFQYYHYSAINIHNIWQDLFQDCLIWQMKTLQPFKTSYLFTSHVAVYNSGDLNPKIWRVCYLLVRIKCIQKKLLISRKEIIRLCTMRLTFSLGPDFTTRLWYLFTNHIALISGYRCFTSQYEVQSVNRMATTWHYYCCHNLLPLVAHTVKCSESFPAWFNTLITVLYCAVQVFFCI